MIKYHIVIDIVGLEFDHLQSGIIPNISRIASEAECAKMEPVFPSVTCTVQASLLSGAYPSEHGIISNGMIEPIIISRFGNNLVIWSKAIEFGMSQRKMAATDPRLAR
jgi:predicted AlkP superfamily pyrophosphatase or phosphodiesterase